MIRHRAWAVALLPVALVTGGCAWLDPEWWQCREVSSTPMRLGVQILAQRPEHGGRRTARKARAGIALYEGGGISLVLDGYPRVVRCRTLAPRELETWIARLELLASRLGSLTAETAGGELIAVLSATERTETWDSVADLDPEALQAARSVACLALETFGDGAERTIQRAGPRLAARLDFPETCALPGAVERPSRRR